MQGIVKQFFNEKEVTSTLVMDALYSGCKQIEEHSRSYIEVRPAACSASDAKWRCQKRVKGYGSSPVHQQQPASCMRAA